MKTLLPLLHDMATMLELLNENPFKIRAIQGAIRALEDVDYEVLSIEEIRALPGIGKGTGDMIAEFMREGQLREMDNLRARVPASVLEMTKLRGLGAKKVRALWLEKGVASIAELESACDKGEVAVLKGFGEKTQANILEAIRVYHSAANQFHLHKAARVAERLQRLIAPIPGALAVEICGAAREGKETVAEVVALVAAQDYSDNADFAARVVAALEQGARDDEAQAEDFVWELDAVEPEESCVRGALNRVPFCVEWRAPSEFALRTHERSSPPEYHQRLLELLSATPAATTNVATNAASVPSEQDLYARLGLPYIPPECRHAPIMWDMLAGGNDGGSWRARKTLANLIDADDLRGALHVHSTWSDGKHSIRAMAERAKEFGYEYIAVCDHSKTAVYANGLTEERVLRQHEEIDALNAENLGIQILKGIESDILPDGSLDYDDAFLENFDVVVASVHSAFSLSPEAMTARLARALSHPATTVLGHPTGRLLLKREAYRFDIDAVFEAALAHNVALEINANPYRLDLSLEHAAEAVKRGIAIAINTDAHNIRDFDNIRYGARHARRALVPRDMVVNALPYAEFRRWLSSRKRKSPAI
jgi:DNA polymerase (family 10)